ncbi:SOSS complex subunit B2 [Haplosporangium sp. Z 27]|nr:SOSS complex subunit B2 [Haplosporangium sp. Z 27]
MGSNSNNSNYSNNIGGSNSGARNSGASSSTGSAGNTYSIADLRPSMRGFNLESDKTGSIVLIIWGEEGALLRNGDLVRIQGGEAKLFKGLIQLSTSKFGKYKKIGEDTMLFVEKPNWSEFEWTQDPNSKSGVMIPLTPQIKMSMANGGIPPMLPGVIQQQRSVQGINPQPAINPSFRGDQRQGQRPFSQNQVVPGSGPSGNRPHHGQYQGHSTHPSNPSQNVNQSQNLGQSQGSSNAPSGSHAPNPRHPKHIKHNKVHRDLDAPDTYPSPRTGLSNSVDEFAQEMKLVSSQGSVGLGVGQLPHSGGPAVPGHMRKKKNQETDRFQT